MLFLFSADDEQSDFFHEPDACNGLEMTPWWDTEVEGLIEGDVAAGQEEFDQILSGAFSYMSTASRKKFRQRVDKLLARAEVCLFVGCLTSQQHASVSQGWICSDKFPYCYTEIEVADPTFYLTQSQYNDTGLTSPSTDPVTPGAWQGSHWSANF